MQCTQSSSSDCHSDGVKTQSSDEGIILSKSASVESQDLSILDLPDDIIYLVLSYLSIEDLLKLCCVNKQFDVFVNQDNVWHHHASKLVVVNNHGHSSTRKECSSKELCRVSPNWKEGKFKDRFAVRQRRKILPWLEKYGSDVWFSTGNVIRHYQMLHSGYLSELRDKSLNGLGGDATRFILRNDMIISGCRNGSVYGWSTSGDFLFEYEGLHRSDVHCLDATKDVIITGSRDASCKIVKLQASQCREGEELRSFDTSERVWSLQVSPCQRIFVAGLAGDTVPALVFDIESGRVVSNLGSDHRKGAGVLDVKFESPHEVLTCGYDTFLRLWDLRTLNCVSQWEEPFDSALYTVVSDGNNTMAVGTARHGMVRLWDKRKTEPIQAYYSHESTSPVYSLAMDYGHLFVALDTGLNIMDFTGRSDAATLRPHGAGTHRPYGSRQNQRGRGQRHHRHYR